jgi:L-lactate dehydrogenase
MKDQAKSRKVVVVGAGAVGATFAYALQMSGGADEIIMIDLDRKRAEAEAADLNHGLMFTPPVEIRAGDYADCSGANVVVITAGAKQKQGQTRLELVGTNIEICNQIAGRILEHTCEAILLIVTNPVDILTYSVLRTSGLPKERVIGSGTVLDSARFRYFLSRHCKVDPRNVHAYVLGEHGDSEVPAWSMTHIAGMQIAETCRICKDMCSDDMREKIAENVKNSAYHIIDAKGATNYAVGRALLRIVRAILRDENSVLTVSTFLEGEFGLSDICLGAPAIVNAKGADHVFDAPLTEEERAALHGSADSLRTVLKELGLQ